MEELEKEIIQESPDINEGNLLFKIWVQPTASLSYILTYNPKKYYIILLVLTGITNTIDRASTKNAGDNMSTFYVLLTSIIGGGLLGWMTVYIYAWGMSGTGKWLKGSANPEEFRIVTIWSCIPSISSLFLLIPQIFIYGDELFKSSPIVEYDFMIYLWYMFLGVEMILGLWTIIIMVKGIALIQNFSIGKAILNLFLPGLVLLIPIIVIAVIYSLLS
jgi:hypothetical protein